MDLNLFTRRDDYAWEIPVHGAMRVPAVIYADEPLLRAMDHKVYEQAVNVAALPGIVAAAYAMPDAHWGYGFPIGGVAAFDADEGGVVSAGGVGFDISCGVRSLHTGLRVEDLLPEQQTLADALYYSIPAGLGSTGGLSLNPKEMDAMLRGGAQWAVQRGYGVSADLERIEERGCAGQCTARTCLRASQAAATRRDGHAGFRQSLSGSAESDATVRHRHRPSLRTA